MIKTDNIAAAGVLARIEMANGQWVEYGNDGRLTTDFVDGASEAAGNGFRARFIDNPHGGDYGWGPLGQTEEEAIALFLAEQAALADDE
ncbi:MAG: hypothetical protein E6Q76_06780 [Rhizobium sp.]|nr:MAG: hypothetical protein E6Q76_06780 [Rhizobium sp.]